MIRIIFARDLAVLRAEAALAVRTATPSNSNVACGDEREPEREAGESRQVTLF
jgi:hypothetical protein